MDELLRAQVAAEDVRDRLSVRNDLLDGNVIQRTRRALRYGARYFHDVFQDFERCAVFCDGDYYLVNEGCRNLSNFLVSRSLPSDLPDGHRERLEELFETLRRADDLNERHAALHAVEELRRADLPYKRRYRAAATEASGIAAAELGGALRRVRDTNSKSGT